MRKPFVVAGLAIAFVIVALLPALVAAAPIVFGHTWGTSDFERASAVVVDASGNVIMAGDQFNATTYVQHGFLAKFDPLGHLVWNREFPFVANASLDMALGPGGDVFVLGMMSARVPGPGPNGTLNNTVTSSFVAHVTSAGSLVSFLNLSSIPFPERIASDPSNGGFVVTGAGSFYGSPIVAAFTANGTLRWARGGSGGQPVGVAVDDSGRVFVLLDRLDGTTGLASFDPSGTLLGQVVIGTPYSTYIIPYDLVMTSGGPLVIGASSGHLFLSLLTSSLSASWSEFAQGSTYYDYPSRAVVLADGSFEVLTNSYGYYNGTYASNVYHFSATGAFLDGSSYVSPAASQGFGQAFALYAGAALPKGGFVLAGTTIGISPQGFTSVPATTSVPGVSWGADSLSWSSANMTLETLSLALLDPSVTVDNFNEMAGPQAWYGEVALPASKLTVTVSASQSSSSSPKVTFSTTVSGGRKPYNYSWSFGDGTFGFGASPSHTYPGTGRYLAQVTVTDSAGLIGYGSAVATVTGPPAILLIQQYPSTNAYAGNYISFYAIALDPDGGTITSYQWNWGDGFSDVTSYSGFYHVYANPGNYTMTLTVTDGDQGLTASKSIPVTILVRPDTPPVASLFLYPYRPTVGATVYFDASSSYDPDGHITNYLWSFGDGTTFNTTGPYASHTYAATGNYTVQLTVTDNAGLTGTAYAGLYVAADMPPVADFTWSPRVPIANQTTFFNAGYFSYDPDGYIVSWVWDFGDGSSPSGNITTNGTSQGPSPIHVYSTYGTFVVTLTVTDNAGLTATASHALHVNAPPVARFTLSEYPAKVGTVVTFDGSSSSDPDGDAIVSYVWYFGDGGYATGPTVTHVFAAPGQFGVTLYVMDSYNATASAFQSVPVVLPKSPVAIIAWSPPRPIAGQTTVVFNGSNSLDPDGTIATYIWEFGDGTVGRGMTVTHVYGNAGTYTLELTVIDQDGLANRDTTTITVVAPSKGTVVAASAPTPLAGADVVLSMGGVVALDVTTGADGSFSLGGLAPGTYALTISVSGYRTFVGTLVWDGFNGDLGVWALLPLSPPASGIPLEVAGTIGMAVVAAALIGVAAYRIRRRRARRRQGEP